MSICLSAGLSPEPLYVLEIQQRGGVHTLENTCHAIHSIVTLLAHVTHVFPALTKLPTVITASTTPFNISLNLTVNIALNPLIIP